MLSDAIMGMFLTGGLAFLVFGSIYNYAWWGLLGASIGIAGGIVVLLGKRLNWWK